MINLLPPEVRSHHRYALRNTKLRRWAISTFFAIIGLLVIGAAGYLYMQQISRSYNGQIDTQTAALRTQNLGSTQKQVRGISSSLKLAVQVLSKEVLFSQLLRQLGSVTPNGAVLSNLTISQDDSAIDITAKATDYDAATQLQVNLADPRNKIFSQADIVSIACVTGADQADNHYPCNVTVRALFANDTQFLFINNGGKK